MINLFFHPLANNLQHIKIYSDKSVVKIATHFHKSGYISIHIAPEICSYLVNGPLILNYPTVGLNSLCG